ncbi:MAG: hypothetical protein AAF772_07670 [Acidobacteriota bacterium]
MPVGLLILLLLLPLALACGKKGDPLPPLRTVPQRIDDLRVRQEGTELRLTMTYPQTTAAGLPLGGIDAVEILQYSAPATADGEVPVIDPRTFELSAKPLLTLRGTELGAAITGDSVQVRLPLQDPLPTPSEAVSFAVRTTKLAETSMLSNRASLVPRAAVAAPTGFAARSTAQGVALTWDYDAPAAAAESEGDDANAIDGFDVFRRDARERGYGEPLRRVGADARRVVDASAAFGTRYIYTVRTLVSKQPLIYSLEAGEAEVDHQDRFAPPLPQNLVALGERGSVRLRWDASDAPDVAGYRLFRRDPGQRDFRDLTGGTLITETTFVDRGLAAGQRFEYRVQVVDQVGNESDRSPVTTAVVR